MPRTDGWYRNIVERVEPESIQCPTCWSEQDESECFLGRLGWLTHYRCRFCGVTFSQSPLSRDIDAVSK